MAEQTQTVESQETGQTPTTDKQTTEQQPGAATQANGAQTQTGAAGRVEDLPDWAQRELKEARQEAQRYRNERKAAEEAQTKAEEERLAQSAEWQKLADSRKAKIEELTPKAELADKLSALMAAEYEARTKDWPQDVKILAPRDDAPVAEKWDWMMRATPLATADKTPVPGNGRRPQPTGPVGQGQNEQKARAQHERWSHNNF